MRLFLAIRAPMDVRNALEACQHRMRERLPGVRCTWVKPADLHLTLVFLGEATEDAVTSLSMIAATAARRQHPFQLSLADLGFFGNEIHGRYRFALWSGLKGQIECAAALAASLRASVSPFTENPTKEGFVPHITLGRIKHGEPSLRNRLPSLLQSIDTPESEAWTVDSFELIESQRTSDGHVYRTVQTYGLKED